MIKLIVSIAWLYCLAHIFIGLPTEYTIVRIGNGLFSMIWISSIVAFLHSTRKRKPKKPIVSSASVEA